MTLSNCQQYSEVYLTKKQHSPLDNNLLRTFLEDENHSSNYVERLSMIQSKKISSRWTKRI